MVILTCADISYKSMTWCLAKGSEGHLPSVCIFMHIVFTCLVIGYLIIKCSSVHNAIFTANSKHCK